MKYLICTDNHFCESSSVIRGRGQKFSDRLENQLKSIDWVNGFDLPVIHLGDFFNRSFLTAEEISALEIIKPMIRGWVFLRGNHEYDGEYDNLGAMDGEYIRNPLERNLGGLKTLFLPYGSKEEDIKEHYDLILAHIGIKDIPFGAKGFDWKIINDNCDIFLNGHLHNRLMLGINKWNMGSLTAQNFSDNCMTYQKGALVLDTQEKTLEFFENPYAFNFYKFSWGEWQNLNPDLKDKIVRPTSCLSISCKEGEKKKITESQLFQRVYYLRVTEDVKKETIREESKPVTLDCLEKFRSSFLEKYGESQMTLEELGEVTR